MDISCLDNHLPTGMHPQLTTSTLFFTQHQLHLLATATLPYLQCQNPAEDTATAFTVQRETDLNRLIWCILYTYYTYTNMYIYILMIHDDPYSNNKVVHHHGSSTSSSKLNFSISHHLNSCQKNVSKPSLHKKP